MNALDKLTYIWFLIDGITHFTLEAQYLFLALTVTAEKSDSIMALTWKEYGKADRRWMVRDPTVISLEILTVFVAGPLAFLAAYAVKTHKPYRHLVQATICIMELYGGFMTFGPEWVDGNPNLNSKSLIGFWVYLVFMNGVWVVLPAILLWESAIKIIRACDVAKSETHPAAVPQWAYTTSVATLVVYAVLIPLILWNLFTVGSLTE